MTKDLTMEASKASYALSKARENLERIGNLMYDMGDKDEDDLKLLLDTHNLLEEVQQELIKILANDNKVKLES